MQMLTISLRSLVAVLLLATVAWSPGRVAGAVADPAADLVAIYMASSWEAMQESVTATMAEPLSGVLEAHLGRALRGDEKGTLRAIVRDVGPILMPRESLEVEMAALIRRHFSPEELQGLLQFYASPLGQRALELTGVLTREGRAMGERIAKSREQEFAERFGEQLAIRMPDLFKELSQKRRR